MSKELLLALIAGAIALTSAAGTIWASIRNADVTTANARAIEELKAAAQHEKDVSRFREPFARAIYDLQSRIFNIVNKGFIDVFMVNGNERERSYVIENTTYLIAQYMCWSELVRREIQYIDLGDHRKTRQLLRNQDALSSAWGTDQHPAVLRIFAGEQRAVGEALILRDARGVECMGYGLFLKTLGTGVNPLIDGIREDVAALGIKQSDARQRLTLIQHALIDLLLALDPDEIRFPKEIRTKI